MLGLVAAGTERALRRFGLRRLDRDLAGGIDHRLAPDHRDLVLLHQEADAVIEALRHRARALHHRARVIGHFLGGEAVIPGVLHVVVDFRRTQQRLGGNAAPVEADAAEIGALDDRRLEAELRRADRGDIASRPGADDDDVEGFGHWGLRYCRVSVRLKARADTIAGGVMSQPVQRASMRAAEAMRAPIYDARLSTVIPGRASLFARTRNPGLLCKRARPSGFRVRCFARPAMTT